jgi:hypothetical protein
MKLISVKEYAEKEKISVQAAYKRIMKKQVKSTKIGSVYLIKIKEEDN